MNRRVFIKAIFALSAALALPVKIRAEQQVVDDEFSYEAWHIGGSEPCGKLAGTFINHPSGKILSSRNFILPNGEHPIQNSILVCGSCGSIQFGPATMELRKSKKVAA